MNETLEEWLRGTTPQPRHQQRPVTRPLVATGALPPLKLPDDES